MGRPQTKEEEQDFNLMYYGVECADAAPDNNYVKKLNSLEP